MVGNKVAKRAGTQSGDCAGVQRADILEQVGHAGEWTRGQSCGDRRLRLIVHTVDDRVDGGIVLLDTRHSRLEQLAGAHFTRLHQLSKAGAVIALIV